MFDIQYLNYAFGDQIREAIEALVQLLQVLQFTLGVVAFTLLLAAYKSGRHK